MGWNQFTQRQYANKEFFLNLLEYLVNPSGILEARSKDLTLTVTGYEKSGGEQSLWQFINIGIPVILILIFGFIYQGIRRKKYRYIALNIEQFFLSLFIHLQTPCNSQSGVFQIKSRPNSYNLIVQTFISNQSISRL